MNCTNHPERESTAACHGCSRPFCEDCLVRFEKLSLCASCKSKFLVDVDERRPVVVPPGPRAPGAGSVAASAPARAATKPPASLPLLGGFLALAFAVLFVFVILGSLAKQYHGWREDKTLADAFQRVATVGAALERCRADSGKYPDQLSALVPKYLAELPGDPYGSSLKYAAGATGRRVWSIGPDGKDDAGDPPADIALLVEQPR